MELVAHTPLGILAVFLGFGTIMLAACIFHTLMAINKKGGGLT